MESFGFEFNNKYLVVVNGVVKKSFSDKKPAYRWCLRYSVNKKNYVELLYQFSDGNLIYVDYWN